MCEICGYDVCPPACPSYEGISVEVGRPTGRCVLCGSYVYRSDKRDSSLGKPYCPVCAARRDRLWAIGAPRERGRARDTILNEKGKGGRCQWK